MRTLCYSVRLESLVRISGKAFRATAFDGSTDIIPAIQVFGRDYDVMKSEAWWISAWILGKKSIQYSPKKQAWFDEAGHQLPTITIERHTPDHIAPKESNEIDDLKR